MQKNGFSVTLILPYKEYSSLYGKIRVNESPYFGYFMQCKKNDYGVN